MNDQRKYRPEIQGVRAVAALLVAVYHIWFNRVSGAVDVFFVVSAFLIFTSLLHSAENNGGVRAIAFWGRLIKRLLPTAYTVIVAIILASIVLLPASRWRTTIIESAAATFYFENWQLAYMSVDYLARDIPPSPFQHFWALSVQGQFYLLVPFLFMLLLLIHRRYGIGLRKLLAASLLVVFAASFTYSVYLTKVDQPFAYFSTFTRLWEFAIGGLLVLVLPYLTLGSRMRFVLGWTGLIALVACGAILHVSTGFPGYLALWPTGAAAAVIIAGSGNLRYGADKILASRALTEFGNISYAFYLWHWPILIFVRTYTDAKKIGVVDGLLIIVIAAILSWLTTKFIESPIRFSRIGVEKPRSAIAFGAVLAGLVLVVSGSWAFAYIDAKRDDQRSIDIDDPDYPGARVLMPGYQFTGGSRVAYAPGPLGIRQDLPGFIADGCRQAPKQTVPTVCHYGVPDADLSLAVVGGSHSGHWIPALRVLAERYDWKIITMIKSGCLFSTETVTYGGGKPYPECTIWNDRVIDLLLETRPDFVFTVGTRGQGSKEHVPHGYIEQWSKLEQAGIAIIAVRDTPWMGFEVAECVEKHGPSSAKCQRPRQLLLAQTNPALNISLPNNVSIIDLSDMLCPARQCMPVIGNVQVYRDQHHLGATFARTMADPLYQALLTAFGNNSMLMPRAIFESDSPQ